jgi:biopolymer transport protein ExbD
VTSKRKKYVPSASSQAEELAAIKHRREKRKLKRAGNKQVKNGLTSMVDIVFLLIFFFMVVTDLQNMEIEEINLPFAVMASPPPDREPKRIVLNLNHNGRIRTMGFDLKTSDELFAQLKRAAEQGPHDSKTGLPDLVVKIRADRAVEYEKVQDVMVQCMRSGLWRISFGTMPDVGKRGLMISPETE